MYQTTRDFWKWKEKGLMEWWGCKNIQPKSIKVLPYLAAACEVYTESDDDVPGEYMRRISVNGNWGSGGTSLPLPPAALPPTYNINQVSTKLPELIDCRHHFYKRVSSPGCGVRAASGWSNTHTYFNTANWIAFNQYHLSTLSSNAD